jgi:hypothetical protein
MPIHVQSSAAEQYHQFFLGRHQDRRRKTLLWKVCIAVAAAFISAGVLALFVYCAAKPVPSTSASPLTVVAVQLGLPRDFGKNQKTL